VKKFIYVVFVLGVLLRIQNITNGFWIDEVLYMNWVNGTTSQEFITVWIGRLLLVMGLDSEMWMRMPSVLSGSLTIFAVYYVIHDKRYAFVASVFVAICPLFYFWSGFARPYAFAGLFVVLGYRHWMFYPVAMMATPLSLLGVNVFEIKKRWICYILMIGAAIFLFTIRPDSGRNFFDLRFLNYAKRLWYIPLLSLTLHLADFLSEKSQRLCKDSV